MPWLFKTWRGLFHTCQLAAAITALYIYKQKYSGITKDGRWTYAVTICAFSITGTVIQSLFYALDFSTGQDLSGAVTLGQYNAICSGLLLIFWSGVFGTFADTFIHRNSRSNHGIYMMKVAIYIDAANMVIWLLAIADAIVEFRRIAKVKQERDAARAESFVPHGWGVEDIEAQTLAIQTKDVALHATVELQDIATHAGPPEKPSPKATGTHQVRRKRSRRTNAESWPTAIDRLSLRSEELQNFWSIYFDRDEPTRECSVCCEERPIRTGFPSQIARACGDHDQDVCRICIDLNMNHELTNHFQGLIHCIHCDALLEYEEIKALASPMTFVKYERNGLRGFVNNQPNFMWCQNAECPSGQEHIGGIDQPLVTCQNCGFKTCFKHQIPWHEGMLCDEYDRRVHASEDEQQTRKQQELASLRTIHQHTKPCANKSCKVPIQKTKGCDHMVCWKCEYEFCWVCGGKWMSGGHQAGCPFQ